MMSIAEKRAMILLQFCIHCSPFKFPGDVLNALEVEGSDDEIELLNQLAEASGLAIPKPLQGLKEKQIRHTAECSADKMKEQVIEFINR